jgi:hypothetical protein
MNVAAREGRPTWKEQARPETFCERRQVTFDRNGRCILLFLSPWNEAWGKLRL